MSLALSSEVVRTRHLGKENVLCNVTQCPENFVAGQIAVKKETHSLIEHPFSL
jgi:hypothetical protein